MLRPSVSSPSTLGGCVYPSVEEGVETHIQSSSGGEGDRAAPPSTTPTALSVPLSASSLVLPASSSTSSSSHLNFSPLSCSDAVRLPCLHYDSQDHQAETITAATSSVLQQASANAPLQLIAITQRVESLGLSNEDEVAVRWKERHSSLKLINTGSSRRQRTGSDGKKKTARGNLG